MAYEAEMAALEQGRVGAPVGWRNPGSGRYGNIVPGPVYVQRGSRCRSYTHTVYIRRRAGSRPRHGLPQPGRHLDGGQYDSRNPQRHLNAGACYDGRWRSFAPPHGFWPVMEQQAQSQPAKSLPVERLRDYLRQLAPAAQTLLMREFERALERGRGRRRRELRAERAAQDRSGRAPSTSARASRIRARLVFACLDLVPDRRWRAASGPDPPLLARAGVAVAEQVGDRGCRRRSWKHGLSTAASGARAGGPQIPDRRGRGDRGGDIAGLARRRSHARPRARRLADRGRRPSGDRHHLRQPRSARSAAASRLPKIIRTFADSQIASVKAQLSQLPSLQKPDVLPISLALVMQRLTSPWQIIRLAISIVGSDEESRIASSPFGVAVSMALRRSCRLVDELRTDIRRGHFDKCAHHLKTLHDGLRDLRTELDIALRLAMGPPACRRSAPTSPMR